MSECHSGRLHINKSIFSLRPPPAFYFLCMFSALRHFFPVSPCTDEFNLAEHMIYPPYRNLHSLSKNFDIGVNSRFERFCWSFDVLLVANAAGPCAEGSGAL